MLHLAFYAIAKLVLFVEVVIAYHLAIDRDLYDLTSLPRATLVRSRRRA